jgi:N-acyl-D-amino-acid deacylase
MYTYVLKNAIVYDGAGNPPKKLDIGIEDDKIVTLSEKIESPGLVVLDLKGKIITPGFIDIQNHSDVYWQLFDNPPLDSLVNQGITSILIGNCGASLAPLISKDSLLTVQKWHSLEGVNLNWQTFEEYANALSNTPLGCNVGSLVGYSTIRRGLIGDVVRKLASAEISLMKDVLQRSISAGAFGLSTGLSYAHELNIPETELTELSQVVAKNRGLLSVHLRSEAEQVVESIEEAINIASRSGVKLKISHFKVRGEKNFHLLEECINDLEVAYHKGVDVHFDLYPYDTIWQPLYSYLPKWSVEAGREVLLKNLANPIQKQKILDYLHNSSVTFSEMIIASTGHKLNVIGKTIGAVAKDFNLSSEETVLKLIENGGSEILVFYKCLDEKQITELLSHPLSVIASDGAGFPLETSHGQLANRDTLNFGLKHPRCFGSTVNFLSQIKDSKNISFEASIQKLTGTPAKIAGFNKRGEIKEGNFADLVVIDKEKLKDRSEYTNPSRSPNGIDYVFVNGNLAARNGDSTGNLAGYFLRKQ